MVRSSVSPTLIKQTLIKGFILGALGAFALLLGGVFLPVPLMRTGGLLLFMMCFGLITFGLLPYRRLTVLQNKPNELRVTDRYVEFWSKGQSRLIIPLEAIEKIEYMEEGIALWIKKGWKEKIVKFQSNLDLSRFQVTGNSYDGADYIFRFFSKRSFEELKDEILG